MSSNRAQFSTGNTSPYTPHYFAALKRLIQHLDKYLRQVITQKTKFL